MNISSPKEHGVWV